MTRADFGQHGANCLDLASRVRIRSVHDVQQEVRIRRLLQGGSKSLDQIVRQMTDNPTVSVSVYVRPSAVVARRVVGSRVAKSASSTSTPAPVIRFSKLDLPALHNRRSPPTAPHCAAAQSA